MIRRTIQAIPFFLVASAWSAPLELTITNPTLNSLGAAQALTDKINAEFQIPEMGSFLKAMSNAQSIANKGQGVSYATEHSLFVVGGSFGLAVSNGTSLSTSTSGGLPPFGLGIQASGMIGISLAMLPIPQLGPIDPKRLTIFVNYFSYSNDTLVDSLTVKTNAFGLHLQYKILDSKNLGGIGILNWGGLAFTTGVDVSSNALKYKIGQSVSTNVFGNNIVWTPNSSSGLSLDASVVTIPFEISTSVRILYVLSLFAGAGVDLNMGKSSITANLAGVISSTGTVNDPNVGNAKLMISDNEGPTFGHLRFFAGPQLNLVPLKNTNVLSIYAQGNVSTGGNYGVHGGVRIAW